MPENGAGSAAATAPMPKAGHSCGTALPAKSRQIGMAFSGHPPTRSSTSALPKACPQTLDTHRDCNVLCHASSAAAFSSDTTQ